MRSIKLTADLAAQGYSATELATDTRAGRLIRVRRGAYAEQAGADARERHRQLVEATVRLCSPDAVVSHRSAAVLHGLPLWTDQLARVEVTRDRPGGGKLRRYVHVRGLPLPAEEVEILAGLRVTSLARTVLDLGCALPIEQAVAAGDAALRLGLRPGDLACTVARADGRHGIRAARRAMDLLDARAESAGESASRVILHRAGVAAPAPQYEVTDADGRVLARCDFGWESQRTLGEFDGRIKYGRTLQPRQDIEEVLFAEKRREDQLRDLGWQVVRWVWADLQSPAAWLDRLDRAFARGSAGPAPRSGPLPPARTPWPGSDPK